MHGWEHEFIILIYWPLLTIIELALRKWKVHVKALKRSNQMLQRINIRICRLNLKI